MSWYFGFDDSGKDIFFCIGGNLFCFYEIKVKNFNGF